MRSLDVDGSSSSDESNMYVVSKGSVRHHSQPDLLDVDEDIDKPEKVKVSVKRTESDVEKRSEKRLSDKKEKRKSRMFTGRDRANTGSNPGEGSMFSLKNPMTMLRAIGSAMDINAESNAEQF